MRKSEEENIKFACAELKNRFQEPLEGFKFPPRAYVRIECMSFFFQQFVTNTGPAIHEDEGNHQEQVGELIRETASSIDDLALKMLFVTVQQNNLEVCIEYAVKK